MTDLTTHMVDRMRVEIAQSAAADCLTAIERLPEGPAREEAAQHIRQAREALSASLQAGETARFLVTVTTPGKRLRVVVQQGRQGDFLSARDRALDWLVDRGRISAETLRVGNVTTTTRTVEPGEVLELEPDEPVLYA